MRRLSITAVCVLQAIAGGYQYGFDIIDQTAAAERHGLSRARAGSSATAS